MTYKYRNLFKLCWPSQSKTFFHKRKHATSSRVKRDTLSLYTSQVAHQAGAYPVILSMERPGVFLLPPGWDTSLSQGFSVPIYTPGQREAL